jgi:hypothetical protein
MKRTPIYTALDLPSATSVLGSMDHDGDSHKTIRELDSVKQFAISPTNDPFRLRNARKKPY